MSKNIDINFFMWYTNYENNFYIKVDNIYIDLNWTNIINFGLK